MKLLLDTHILLWALSDDARLSGKARQLIENPDNSIYYSIISLWEVQLKKMAHPESMPIDAMELKEYCGQAGFQCLPVNEAHIFALSGLKRDEHALPHKDPFDRLLICQALTENMMFLTHDSLIPQYNVPCIFPV